MILALFLLFADVVCVDNGNGTWTCSGSGFDGVTTNETGQTVCTNCVNMTPSKCQELKSSILSDCDSIDDSIYSANRYIDSCITWSVEESDRYLAFTDWPYSVYDYSNPDSSAYGPGLIKEVLDITTSPNSIQRSAAADIIRDGWNSSPNNVCIDTPVGTFGNDTLSAFRVYAANVAALWHGSYLVAQSVVPRFNSIETSARYAKGAVGDIQTGITSIRTSANQITCASCQLSSGGDGGGGSGVDVGCAECYLVFLRRYQEQLDLLNNQVSALTNLLADTKRIVGNMADYFPSFSNHLQRIDDYLLYDQSNTLASVAQAVIVISNNVDSIQKYYFHTFSNASDITSGDYGAGSPSMEEVFKSIFKSKDQGGFQLQEYQKYDWFRRIELQLSQISGIFSETNVESLSDSDYNSMKDAVENFEDLSDEVSSSGGSVVSVGSSLRSAAQTIGSIFPSSAPPGEITLLEARYWIGDMDLVLRTDFQVVSFCRALFGLIWVTLACVGLWLLLSRSWVILFDIARWFCNWFPKIFGN